jgi:hypothetical protein
MKGVCQHCKEKHLHRYLAKFDFRYNTPTALGFNDLMRAEALAAEIKGKRLAYRRPNKNHSIECAKRVAKRFLAWRRSTALRAPLFSSTMLRRTFRHNINSALKALPRVGQKF